MRMSTAISTSASWGQRGIIIRLREQAAASQRKRTALMIALKMPQKHESLRVPGFVMSGTNVYIIIQHVGKRRCCVVHQRQHFPRSTQLPINDFLLLLTCLCSSCSFNHLSVPGTSTHQPHQTYKSCWFTVFGCFLGVLSLKFDKQHPSLKSPMYSHCLSLSFSSLIFLSLSLHLA